MQMQIFNRGDFCGWMCGVLVMAVQSLTLFDHAAMSRRLCQYLSQ